MITAREQRERAEKARFNPPKPPLDDAARALIKESVAKGSGKTSAASLIKRIEAAPLNARAAALMTLAMANPREVA